MKHQKTLLNIASVSVQFCFIWHSSRGGTWAGTVDREGNFHQS